jgi:hypothetical protein
LVERRQQVCAVDTTVATSTPFSAADTAWPKLTSQSDDQSFLGDQLSGFVIWGKGT